MLEYCLA
jgi:large subunit ribosomal protein L32